MTVTDQDPTVRVSPSPATPVRTFHARRGRLGLGRVDAMDRLWPRFGWDIRNAPGNAPVVSVPTANVPTAPTAQVLTAQVLTANGPAAPADVAALFGRHAPLVLEIGSGMGDATVAMAAADPDRNYLAVEVHLAGIAALLVALDRAGLTNVRVARGDALHLLRHLMTPDSVDAVHAFFPDPWPKARHHKRRLVQPEHVALLRSRLAPGGTLHCATDWAEYAEAMRATLDADPGLTNAYPGFAPRPAHRPVTRFERRGLAAGREIFDLIYRRSA